MAKLCNQFLNRLAKQNSVAYLNPDSPLSFERFNYDHALCGTGIEMSFTSYWRKPPPQAAWNLPHLGR